MNISPEFLKAKLNEYTSGHITGKTLYQWATVSLHEILKKHEYIDFTIFPVYVLLTRIISAWNEVDDLHENDIVDISRILVGETDTSFLYNIKLPQQEGGSAISALQISLNKYPSNICLEDCDSIQKIIKNSPATPRNFYEMILLHLSAMLSDLFFFDTQTPMIVFSPQHSIGVKREEMSEKEGINKILAAIDCYLGKKAFMILLTLCNGHSNYSFIM